MDYEQTKFLDYEAYMTGVNDAKDDGEPTNDLRFVVAYLVRKCQKAYEQLEDLTDYRNPQNIMRETHRPAVLQLTPDADGWSVVKTLFKNGYHVEIKDFTDNIEQPNIQVWKK